MRESWLTERPIADLRQVFACSVTSAADIYLLRDKKGVLHITNAPVDPGTQLVVRQAPRMARPNVLAKDKRGLPRARVLLPMVDPGLQAPR